MTGALAKFWSAFSDVMEFGYDATVDKSRRGRPASVTKSEDEQLSQYERKKAIATQRDQIRNLTWVAWAARKHINYVSHFAFRATTDDKDLNIKLDGLMDEWSLPPNCDVAKRHSLDEMMALFESGQVIDGDCGLMKAGTALQGIESDRITVPNSTKNNSVKIPTNLTEHGLVLRKDGSTKSYAVCNRTMSGFQLQKMVADRDMFFTGYFKRFDQTRGISPLLTAINANQDIYECNEYTRIKMKMHSMLGAQITREMPSSSDGWTYDEEQKTTEGGNTRTEYSFDLEAGMKLEMDPGDKVELLESKTPSDEYQAFIEFTMRVTLLALDIPFSMFNSKQNNNNAMRMDYRQYLDSARKKQNKNRRVLDEITSWKMDQWLVQGKLTLDEYRQVKWVWQPSGVPLVDPKNEISAMVEELSNGLNSRTSISRELGRDIRQTFKELAEEEKEIDELGLKGITIGLPGQQSIGAQQEKAEIEREEIEQESKPEQTFEEGKHYYDENDELFKFENGELVRV